MILLGFSKPVEKSIYNKIINEFKHEKIIKQYVVEKKYGKYCEYIAYNILQDKEDTKECINDAFLNVWNAIFHHKAPKY